MIEQYRILGLQICQPPKVKRARTLPACDANALLQAQYVLYTVEVLWVSLIDTKLHRKAHEDRFPTFYSIFDLCQENISFFAND